MISFVQPLPIGDAVRVLLAPADGTVETRVLRKVTDDITDQNDGTAAIVFDDLGLGFIDTTALVNGTPYFYKAFDFDGTTWTPSASVSATPAATATTAEADVLELVRSRLAAGLKNEVTAQRLVHPTGSIPVFTAPPLYDETRFPMVSVHLTTDTSSIRGIGDQVSADTLIGGSWNISDGWLSDVSLKIIGWALNPDVRIALRKAIKKVIIGNLLVFDQAGMEQISFSQTDMDDMESYAAPVYTVEGSFTCIAPSIVTGIEEPVVEVDVTVDVAAGGGPLDLAAA